MSTYEIGATEAGSLHIRDEETGESYIYVRGDIRAASIQLSSLHQGGEVQRSSTVSLGGSFDGEPYDMMVFTFSSGAQAEDFYDRVLAVLGWT